MTSLAINVTALGISPPASVLCGDRVHDGNRDGVPSDCCYLSSR
jgi:hypothetical protein